MNAKNKNLISFLLILALWNLLFFRQNPGLNVLLFGLSTLAIALSFHKPRISNSWFWLGTAAVLINATAIALYGNETHTKWFTISILVTFSTIYLPLKSVFTVVEHLLIKTFAGPILGLAQAIEPKSETSKSNFKIGYSIIAVIIVGIFTILYSFISEKFSTLIGTIIPDISFESIGFLIFGALILFPWLMQIRMPEPLTTKWFGREIKITLGFNATMNTILAILNVMLLIVLGTNGYDLITDVNSFGRSELHGIVDTSIASIILAIAVIIIGDSLIRQTNSKVLKTLSYLFLFLNFALVAQAFIQNTNYILGSEITPKRIGVYFFLGLVSLGLIYTFVKIQYEKSLLWLINNNAWTVLLTISLYNIGPWDTIVADSLVKSYLNKKLNAYDLAARMNTLQPFVFPKMEAVINTDIAAQENYIEMKKDFNYAIVNSKFTIEDYPSWSWANYNAYNQEKQ